MVLRQGPDVAAHLMRVASGLDSVIMGEGQILAQVKQVGARTLCGWSWVFLGAASQGGSLGERVLRRRLQPRRRQGVAVDPQGRQGGSAGLGGAMAWSADGG